MNYQEFENREGYSPLSPEGYHAERAWDTAIAHGDRSVEQIAKACHEVNRAYCRMIGDSYQKPWEESPEWQRVSAIQGVAFKLNNPEVSPARMHEEWMKAKAQTGWVYGKVKDEILRTHPCMVPYDELPMEQKIKDYLFTCTVESLRNPSAEQEAKQK